MKIDKLTMVCGRPIQLDCGLRVIQHTIDQIADIGYDTYNSYLNLIAIKKHTLLDTLGLPSDTNFGDTETYRLILVLPGLADILLEGMAFFLNEAVEISSEEGVLLSESGIVIDDDAFRDFRNAVLRAGCIHGEEEEEHLRGSKKAWEIFEKIKKGREDKRKAKKGGERDVEIDNVISALGARSPNYNLLNIGGLTVWQLYNQFSRMTINEQYDVWAQKWAAWGQDDFDFSIWYKSSQSE